MLKCTKLNLPGTCIFQIFLSIYPGDTFIVMQLTFLVLYLLYIVRANIA